MSQESTQDLRAHSLDRKRAIDSQHKWGPKWAARYDAFQAEINDTKRPVRLRGKRYNALRRNENARPVRKANIDRKLDLLADPNGDNGSDASRSLHLYDDSADVVRGHGDEVLGMAVTKAVKRFEDRQTTELVKNEYEVLDDFSNSDEKDSDAGTHDEDDFELV